MEEILKIEEKRFDTWRDLERYMDMQFDDGNACLVTQLEYGFLVEVFECNQLR